MKTFVISILLIFIISCTNENNHNFDWLLGKWSRQNDEDNNRTYEIWEKKSKNEYLGIGYTLQENDTIFKEDIRLFKLNNNWFYEVTRVNPGSTLFKVSNFNQSSFVCENQENDFPKKIEYSLNKNIIKATISNSEISIDFIFNKIQP